MAQRAIDSDVGAEGQCRAVAESTISYPDAIQAISQRHADKTLPDTDTGRFADIEDRIMSTTSTTRLGLVKPTPGTGEPVNRGVMNTDYDKIDAAISFTECTNATRPTGADAWDGRAIIESDTGKAYIREDGAWRQIIVNTGSAAVVDGALSVSGSISHGGGAPNVQLFATAGTPTWTKPAGAVWVVVEMVGSGGAGGGAAAASSGQNTKGAGGGSGAFARHVYAASALGATVAITIPAGGTGVSGAAGNNGGTTIFGALSVSGGAGGGVGATSAGAFGVGGGAGGTGSGGSPQIVMAGQPGGNAWGDANLCMSGQGGPSHFGGGGAGRAMTSSAVSLAGNAAPGYGAGGGGAAVSSTGAAAAGGAGGVGAVLVTTYFI